MVAAVTFAAGIFYTREVKTITGKITKIAQGVIDGNSHYYLMIEGSEEI